jgi:segregation and condensation protein A
MRRRDRYSGRVGFACGNLSQNLAKAEDVSLGSKPFFYLKPGARPMSQANAAQFVVSVPDYRGPIDLLLYLVRRHELEIDRVSITEIVSAYGDFLEGLEAVDVSLVGDFLEAASMLCELKIRAALPHTDGEEGELDHDPREDLVHRLLVFKEFKDAAILLDQQARQWQERFPRVAGDLAPPTVSLADRPIKEIELWDLVSSFGRILRDQRRPSAENIVLDDTPMEVYMERIHQRLAQQPRVAFSELFELGMHKSALIGMFLAVLELVRHHDIRTEQDSDDAEIWVYPHDRPGSESAASDPAS